MGLPSLALRMATVHALRGQTWAGQNVLDEPHDPIAIIMTSTEPVLAVYGGVDHVSLTGRDWLAGDRKCGIVIQIYLPPRLALPDSEDVLDTLGAGGATALHTIERQIESVLSGGLSEWSKLWRDIVFTFHDIEAKPYLLETQAGSRIAAREIEIICDTISSPVIGSPAVGPWGKLIELMRNEAELEPIANLIQSSIESYSEMPGWKQAEVMLGLRDRMSTLIGIGPVDQTEAGEPSLATELTISGLLPNDTILLPE